MLLNQVLQCRLVHPLGSDKGSICLHDNVTLLKPLHDIVPGQPGVDLILADVDLTTDSAVDVFLKLLKVVDSEVGDSDRAHLTGLLGFDKRLPGAQASLLSAVGGMDQDPFSLLMIFTSLIKSRNLRIMTTYKSM